MLTSPAKPVRPLMSSRWPLASAKWVFIGVGLVLAFVPVIWTVGASFRSEADLFGHPESLLPTTWTLHGYEEIWKQLPFLLLLLNSLVFAGATTLLTLLFDSMCAYALSRLEFRGRTICFWLILVTLMVPFQTTLLPVFDELFHLGWLNTYQGLIIPRASSAFGIFLFRQFFMSIPRELDEAARIDGASHFRIYATIILPLAKPAIGTVALLNFNALWNDLLWPLIVSNAPDKMTLPEGLALFGGQHITDHAVLLAGAVISVIPIVIAFFLAQRYFVAGFATTGLK